jgi:hypothetical protein
MKASVLISLRIAKLKNPFTIGEKLVLPSNVETCGVVSGDEAPAKIKYIPLSNDTVSNNVEKKRNLLQILQYRNTTGWR